jgi:hypothetical protein
MLTILARRGRDRRLIIIVFITIASFALSLPLLFGLYYLTWASFLPVVSHHKLTIFESHLRRGERLTDFEKQFDVSIPRPDSHPYYGATQNSVPDGEAYYYLTKVAFCSEAFQGFAVHIDSQGRIRSWNPITSFGGC